MQVICICKQQALWAPFGAASLVANGRDRCQRDRVATLGLRTEVGLIAGTDPHHVTLPNDPLETAGTHLLYLVRVVGKETEWPVTQQVMNDRWKMPPAPEGGWDCSRCIARARGDRNYKGPPQLQKIWGNFYPSSQRAKTSYGSLLCLFTLHISY